MLIFFSRGNVKIKSTIENKSPVILSLLGIAGFVTSIIMAAKTAPVAKYKLELLPEDSTFLEKAKAVTPLYAPTVGMTLISTACIVGSHRVYNHRYSSLLAVYTIGEKSLKKWQDSIFDEVGEKKFEKIKERVIAPEDPLPDSVMLDDERVLFYDSYSGRHFWSGSVEAVRQIINDLNMDLFREDFVAVNDFYYKVGLSRTEFGDDVGWHIGDGGICITFDAYLHNDRPCITISFGPDGVIPKRY